MNQAPSPLPRDLQLKSLDEVHAEVDRLHTQGYDRAGNWDLAQVLDHLTFFMRGALEGYQFKVPWVIKALLGKFVKNRILSQGKMKRGVFTPQKPLPVSGQDEAAAVSRFHDILHRLQKHEGEYLPSPFFGVMTREETLQLNLIHCNHHLGYLLPRS